MLTLFHIITNSGTRFRTNSPGPASPMFCTGRNEFSHTLLFTTFLHKYSFYQSILPQHCTGCSSSAYFSNMTLKILFRVIIFQGSLWKYNLCFLLALSEWAHCGSVPLLSAWDRFDSIGYHLLKWKQLQMPELLERITKWQKVTSLTALFISSNKHNKLSLCT